MYNKRLLLLGITIIGSSWINPTASTDPFLTITKAGNSLLRTHQLSDTERVASSLPALYASDHSSANNDFNKDLFTAVLIGNHNGVRLNPKAFSFVQDYVKDNWDELQDVRRTGKPYFTLIEKILAQYELPRELKYLAVIESNLKVNAVSNVGAVGPWQLMPQTARDLGLKVTRGNDERKNYVKSTRAAALYLRDLYNELGDWLLVIAAYNTGTSNVYHAIRKAGSRNFWDLQYYLPAESRIHVKKFIGTQYVFEGQGSITTLTREEATEQLPGSAMFVFHRKLSEGELQNAETINVSGKYHSSIIARYILMDSTTFARYNPDFDKVMASNNNSYELKLPADKMALFASNKYQILTESAQLMNEEQVEKLMNQKIAVNN